MATLSDFGVSGLGIRQPNLRHRFQVRFLNSETNEKLEISDDLASQAIRVLGVIERNVDPMDLTGIVFQDDVANVAFKGLLNLQTMENFTIAIDVLDGATNILRTTLLKSAKLESFYHGDFDYSLRSENAPLEIDAYFPARVGEITNMIQENPVGAAILNALGGAQVRIFGKNKFVENATCELQAQFSFEDVKYEFPNLKNSG